MSSLPFESSSQSLSDLIRGRQARIFVGRDSEVSHFSNNLNLGADDPDRKVIYAIDGQGGTGKSFLSRRLLSLSRDSGALSAVSDIESDDILAMIESFTNQIGRDAGNFASYQKVARQYLRKRAILLTDPNAPDNTAAIITEGTVRLTLAAAKIIPGTSSLTEPVDTEAAVDYVNAARRYLWKQLRRQSDYNLILAPVPLLTAAFLSDLREVALDVPNITLCVDTFERRTRWTQDWLIRLLEEEYGPVPSNLILILSGQKPLDANRWSSFGSIIKRITLHEFSADEVQALLYSHKIAPRDTDIESILQSTGGLPVLVDLFVKAQGDLTAEEIDPAESAVERFLKHEPDLATRDLILKAAHCRVINSGVLSCLSSDSEESDDESEHPSMPEGEAFLAWISQLPFVHKLRSSWRFHQVVRLLMVRYFRERRPENARKVHQVLSRYYSERIESITVDTEYGRRDFYEAESEFVYHIICCRLGSEILQAALRCCLLAAEIDSDHAVQLSQALADAGHDSGDDEIARLGNRLLKAEDYQGYWRQEYLFDTYLTADLLNRENKQKALKARAEVRLQLGKHEGVLQDADFILRDLTDNIEVEDVLTIQRVRAYALYRLGRNEESLQQVEALRSPDGELDARGALILSKILQEREQLTESRATLEQAILLEPEIPALRFESGRLFEALGEYQLATSERTKYIELTERPDGRAHRGIAYRWLGNYQRAVNDFETAQITADLKDEPRLRRVECLNLLGQTDEALIADASRCASAENMMGWATFIYGLVLARAGRKNDSVRQFDRALQIGSRHVRREPHNIAARFNTAIFCAATGNSSHAIRLLADFSGMNPDSQRIVQARILHAEVQLCGITLPDL